MTTPINFPTSIYMNALSITPRDAVAMTRSSLSFAEKVYDWGGEMWVIDGTLPLMSRETAAAFQAFLLKLKGPANAFLFPVAESSPRGTATGTPLVNGAGQTGYGLITDGWTPSITGIMKAGDWLNLGSAESTRLHMVTEDVDSDASGNATIPLWPALRSSPGDNDPVTVTNCKGLFRLTENVGWDKDINKHYSFNITAEEALNG